MHTRTLYLFLLTAVFLLEGCSVGLSIRKADKLYEYGEYYAAAIQYGKA